MVTGVICSILLFIKSDKKTSNKFLGLGILGFVWLNTKTLLLSLNLWDIHGFGYFPNGIELALPPLFYFYVISLLQSDFKLRGKDWLHFVPFFLSQAYAIVVYIAIMQTQLPLEKSMIANSFHFNRIKLADDQLMALSGLVYLYLAYRYIRKYKDWLSENTSDTQFSELGFLKVAAVWMFFSLLYTVVNLVLNSVLHESHEFRWRLGHLIVATLVYYLGLVGYKNSDVIPTGFTSQSQKKPKRVQDPITLEVVDNLDQILKTNKVYLNPNLSLQELAKSLEVSDATLSHVINTHYQKNFRSFIKQLRVEEVKKRLLDGSLGTLSLLGLAKECGFNSEASFYRIFKAETGLTPKQFLSQHSSPPPSSKD